MKLPTSPAKFAALSRPERRKVQQWYDQAVQFSATGGHQEAHLRLRACLKRDPGNSLYVELTLRNLEAWDSRSRMGWLGQWSWRRRVADANRKEKWADLQEVCLDAVERQAPNEIHGESLRHWARCCAAYDQLTAAMFILQWCDARYPHAETTSLAAQTLSLLGRFEDAADAWRQTLEADPDHQLAQEKLAATAASQSSGELAPEPDDPTDVAGMLRAAQSRSVHGQWLAAQGILQKAMSASSAHPDLQIAWEDLQLDHARDQLRQAEMQGLPEERQQELAELLSRLELEIYDARGTRRPDEPQWRIHAARLLLADHRADAAAKQLEPLPDPATWPEAIFLYAKSQQWMRHFAEALEIYETAIAHAGDASWRPQAVEQATRLAEAMGRADLVERWAKSFFFPSWRKNGPHSTRRLHRAMCQVPAAVSGKSVFHHEERRA